MNDLAKGHGSDLIPGFGLARVFPVNYDTMELTATIDDPKMYTLPWLGLNKLPLRLQPADFDIPELICSPSEMANYNQQIGNVVLTSPQKKKK